MTKYEHDFNVYVIRLNGLLKLQFCREKNKKFVMKITSVYLFRARAANYLQHSSVISRIK